MTLEAGKAIGPYRVVEQAGRGGMATVYKAYHEALARNVAIKVLPTHLATDEAFRARFKAEALTIAKLRHPNILAVYDSGEQDGLYYIVTEFIDGGTLAEQLGRPLPLEYVTRVLAPVASALDYAHAREVLHRDMKPSNILIARDGTPVISDFGLARMMDSMSRLTQTGALVGTPEYMAPEQAAGETAGPATDRYALAVIAYEMLVGSVPYSADTPLATLIAHLHKPLPIPRDRNPDISEGTQAVLQRGLAKAPGERYATAASFVSALAGGGSGNASITTPSPVGASGEPGRLQAPVAQVARPGSRRNLLIGAAAALLLIAGAATAYVLTREPEAPPMSIGVELDKTTVSASPGSSVRDPVSVKVTYSNNRDALLSDVIVVLRPMKDARVDSASTFTEKPNGFEFSIGDIGPWASGEIAFTVSFQSVGSRVVQATISSKELAAGFTSSAETVNVTAR